MTDSHSAQLIMSYGLNSLRRSCGPLTMTCQCADGQRWSWVTYQLRWDASERCLVYAESLLEMCKENGYYQVVLDCSSALFSHHLTHQYVLLRHLLVLRCMLETSLSDIINMCHDMSPPIGETPIFTPFDYLRWFTWTQHYPMICCSVTAALFQVNQSCGVHSWDATSLSDIINMGKGGSCLLHSLT